MPAFALGLGLSRLLAGRLLANHLEPPRTLAVDKLGQFTHTDWAIGLYHLLIQPYFPFSVKRHAPGVRLRALTCSKETIMFRELAPLLTKRSLVLTLASVGDDRIRITITPRPMGKDEAKELAQPFAVEGTAEELDAELSQSIVSYTAEHLTLARSLEQVKASMEAALKEAKDDAAKKIAEAKKSSKQPSPKPPFAEAKVEVKTPATPSLFDVPTAPSSSSAPAVDLAGCSASQDSLEKSRADAPPAKFVAAASEPPASEAEQSPMFHLRNEEDEILQEAFYGAQDSHIAA